MTPAPAGSKRLLSQSSQPGTEIGGRAPAAVPLKRPGIPSSRRTRTNMPQMPRTGPTRGAPAPSASTSERARPLSSVGEGREEGEGGGGGEGSAPARKALSKPACGRRAELGSKGRGKNEPRRVVRSQTDDDACERLKGGSEGRERGKKEAQEVGIVGMIRTPLSRECAGGQVGGREALALAGGGARRPTDAGPRGSVEGGRGGGDVRRRERPSWRRRRA